MEGILHDYPYLASAFVDMTDYLYRPAEAVNMFLEAIKILDEHTLHDRGGAEADR